LHITTIAETTIPILMEKPKKGTEGYEMLCFLERGTSVKQPYLTIRNFEVF